MSGPGSTLRIISVSDIMKVLKNLILKPSSYCKWYFFSLHKNIFIPFFPHFDST